ncbi:uncharacterized protein [Nicotiana sylvestris]|uniref:uncharacterized protein n=1 Tax=Nicotiana sylvestris TaxID=4096 RepID=UPI00388C4990
MGLNEVYIVVGGSILMMNPLPSLAQAFSLLIQEEKQREIKPSNQLMFESTSLNVNTSKKPTFKTNYNLGNNYTSNSRPRPVCEHCRKPGHTKDKCYKLHGYPQGFQNSNQPFQNNNQRFQGANQNFQNPNQGFRFNKGKRAVANVHGPLTDMMTNNGDEGIVVCTSSVDFGKLSCRCFKSKTDTWILDSGASNHMTFNKSSMCDITVLPYPLLVILPNGYKVKVIEVGSVKIAPSLKRPLEIGKVKDELYLLCSQCLKHKDTSSSSTTTKFSIPCLSVHPCDVQDAYFPCVYSPLLNKIASASSNTDVNVPSSAIPLESKDVSSFPSVLKCVPFIDFVDDTDNNVQTNIESNIDGASHMDNELSPVSNNEISPASITSTSPPNNHIIDSLPFLESSPVSNLNEPVCIPSLNAPLSNHHSVSPEVLIHDSQSLMQSVCQDNEPSSYEEATINPAWQVAMTQEFEAFHANNTWDLVPLPAGKKAIGYRWVYKVKHKADGSIERFKARLVVK